MSYSNEKYSDNKFCTMVCWLIAALLGVVSAIVLAWFAGFGALDAIFFGLVIFGLGGFFLSKFICGAVVPHGRVDEPSLQSAPAAAAPAPTATPAAEAEPVSEPVAEAEPALEEPAADPAPSPAAPAVKASTPLAGEAELASRKGSWKYEGEAKADAPAPAPKTEPAASEDYDKDGIVEGKDEGTKPATLDGPRNGKADNLKEIKGVGPKMEKLLNSLGFYHFDQVAGWSADEVAWVDANLEGFKGRVSRDKWVDQAKILASGGETEFSKRVEDGDVY